MPKKQDMLEKTFVKAPDFIYRKIADECLLVPIRHQVGDLNYIFALNPLAGHIWELIDGQRKGRDILDRIVAEFEVSPQEAEKDLIEFLLQLQEIGGLKEN